MGRFNYSFADKYIATVNMRADGSSKLGANNKWGFSLLHHWLGF